MNKFNDKANEATCTLCPESRAIREKRYNEKSVKFRQLNIVYQK